MDLQLAGKTALVTGASSGIGGATARVLGEEGADVALTYNQNRAGAEANAQTIRSLDGKTWVVQLDLGDPASITRTVQELEKELSGLDVLILCAGKNEISALAEISLAEWDEIFQVNLRGAFQLVQSALSLMNSGGSIVTVASVAAHTGAPHHMHYAAAKAGLVNLTKSLARTLAPEIRVNCVAPGIAFTPMGEEAISSLPENYAEKKLLVQRFAEPEEIARTIVFAASPVTGFMTGTTLDINGGRLLR